MTLPLTPYAGTSGWSGSDTSQERAVEADLSGETADRQRATLIALKEAGANGLTYQELGLMYGWHHGKSSGVLSVLHKEGLIARLADERRNRCAVYVALRYTNGRPLASHGRKSPLDEFLNEWLTRNRQGWSKAGRNPRAFIEGLREVSGIE